MWVPSQVSKNKAWRKAFGDPHLIGDYDNTTTHEERLEACATECLFQYEEVNAEDKSELDNATCSFTYKDCKYWFTPTQLPAGDVAVVVHRQVFSYVL